MAEYSLGGAGGLSRWLGQASSYLSLKGLSFNLAAGSQQRTFSREVIASDLQFIKITLVAMWKANWRKGYIHLK